MSEKLDILMQSSAKDAWQYFLEISKIPRESGNEAAARLWLKENAERKGWITKLDNYGNLLIKVPGAGKLANKKPLCIQGHIDMVCEKSNKTSHDFEKDSLNLRIENDFIMATETTLGADNAVAIAMGMALADLQITEKLPLELLWTVEEETGLFGASNLDEKIISARTLINLDSEEEGTFIIGCSGGQQVRAFFNLETLAKPLQGKKISIENLRGGHSGMDVGSRFNAIAEMIDLLRKLNFSGEITEFNAGDKYNAIPREGFVKIINTNFSDDEFYKIATQKLAGINKTEPDTILKIEDCDVSEKIIGNLFSFLAGIKNGIISMHPDFLGIVQSSTSITVAKKNAENQLLIVVSTRSSSEKEKYCINEKIFQLAEKNQAEKVIFNGDYHGWNPDKKSKILAESSKIYQEIFEKKPNITAIHAGLECGVIGTKIMTNELISFGPNIHNPHSPEERMEISSFNRIYDFLVKIISTDLT